MDEDFEAELYEEAHLQAQDFTPDRPGPPHDYPPPAVPPGYDSWEQFMEEARRSLEYVALVHGPGGVNEVAEAFRRNHPDPTGERIDPKAKLRTEIREHFPGPFTLEQERWLADVSPEDAARADHLHAATLRIHEQIAWSDWANKQMRSEESEWHPDYGPTK